MRATTLTLIVVVLSILSYAEEVDILKCSIRKCVAMGTALRIDYFWHIVCSGLKDGQFLSFTKAE